LELVAFGIAGQERASILEEDLMNFTRLKLYHYPLTRSARVKWLLHELLGDDFDVEVVPLYECVQYSPEYLEKNPNHCVPSLEITLENGERRVMLESGAMVALLADIFPEKGLAPKPDVFSMERADYLQMLHFLTTSMDMMLWQIRIHTHLLGSDSDEKTIIRYRNKFTQEVEPQLKARLGGHEHICGPRFCAADCVTGPNVMWAQGYGLCQDAVFTEYIGRLSERPAFVKAFSDATDFSLTPPDDKRAAWEENFAG
jgi:glutathione S-transferase